MGLSAKPSVLVVDDDHKFADALVSLLNGDGITAIAAYSGSEAIESALRSPPDFVVMDICMDGIDGVDAAIAISETQPPPRILLMSGHPDIRTLLTKSTARGHRFEVLAKPVELAFLRRRLSGSRRGRAPHRPINAA